VAGFATYDSIIAAITAGQVDAWSFQKTAASASQGAGTWHTLWKGVGSPGAGADPASTPGAAYEDTAGGIFFPDRTPDQKHALFLDGNPTNGMHLVLYDRLVGVGAVNLVGTGSKTVNSTTLPRYAGADATNVEAWLEVTTATTTSVTNVNISSYTAADGTTGQVGGSVLFPAAATVVGSMIRLPLGTKAGVRSVETLNVATAPNAGVANLILLHRIAEVALTANVLNTADLMTNPLSLPRVYDGATLALMCMMTSAVTPTVTGRIYTAYD
jgi:hypothetical protein